MIALSLSISLDDKGGLKIVGIPSGEAERKITLQVLAEAIKTVAALKPADAILTPNKTIIAP